MNYFDAIPENGTAFVLLRCGLTVEVRRCKRNSETLFPIEIVGLLPDTFKQVCRRENVPEIGSWKEHGRFTLQPEQSELDIVGLISTHPGSQAEGDGPIKVRTERYIEPGRYGPLEVTKYDNKSVTFRVMSVTYYKDGSRTVPTINKLIADLTAIRDHLKGDAE